MKLNVVSFNIRCCDDPNGYSIPERAPRLKTVLDRYDPDIIGMQECRPTWMPILTEDYGETYEIYNRYRSTDQPESSPILWKKDMFDCLDRGYFWFSDTPEVESKGWDERFDCYRMCLWVILKHRASGRVFTYMNTHFGFGDKGQMKSVDLLHSYSLKISDHPTLITGDFNMFPHYPAYARMASFFTDVNAATARDMRNTFHGYTFTEYLDELIDYCFVDSRIRPLDYKRIDDLVDGKFPSDHYGIQAMVEI